MSGNPLRILVAVGSRSDQVCSVGAFARAEARALSEGGAQVEILEPTAAGRYPVTRRQPKPDVILFHAPSLHDRGRPWRPLLSAARLRAAFPAAAFVPVVHEFSEAPRHWRMRQRLILALARGVVVNSEADRAGLEHWGRRVLRTPLGPTLFLPELMFPGSREDRAKRVAEKRAEARAAILGRAGVGLGASRTDRWVLHPGLLTPGKGLNFLKRLAPALNDAHLIAMGGLGPKESDRAFARASLAELEEALHGRLTFVEAPDDELFRRFLLAADLVVLPYDAGLSERRSSFLSAMSCGANVWTTTGEFTPPLRIERSGAHALPVESWTRDVTAATRSVTEALAEDEAVVLDRRVRNLDWAAERSWPRRVRDLLEFISSLR